MDGNMNKKKFSDYVSQSFGCSKEAAEAVVFIFSESVQSALAEGRNVEIENFGEFKSAEIKNKNPFRFAKKGPGNDAPVRRLLFKPAKIFKKTFCG